MSWLKRKSQCQEEGHDWEPVQGMMLKDILHELEREGYPVIVRRVVYGLNPSGEPIFDEAELEVQIGDAVFHKTNKGFFDRICLRCGQPHDLIEPTKESWAKTICEQSKQVAERKSTKQLRRDKAKKLWEDYKYGTSE